jgi:glutathione S-transferase
LIDLYTWPTPNGHKVHILLEETGLEYRVHPIDIGAGDQFKPEFLAISPNNKIPAMVDQRGPGGKPALAESGAMLFYLASKTGRFLAAGRARSLGGDAVGHDADGPRRPDARPGAPLPAVRAGEDRVRHEPLPERS